MIVVTLFLFLYVFWKGKKVFSLSFLLDKPAGVPLGTAGGIYPALMGSIYLGALSALIGGVLGIGAAIYLVFYSTGKRFSVLVNMAITGLSGIPSILFGLVGYTLLIYRFGLNRSLLCSALCVAAMIIPFVAIRAEKILEEKGREYMKNSLSLGLSREYALRKLILPVCSVELLGTVALGMAYGMGAVAPILYTGAVMQADVPHSLSDPFMSLPYHLYILVNNGFSLDYAYGTAFVLMLFLLIIQLICKFIYERTTDMLNIENLKCGFGKHEILHGISLTIPKGQITAIVGQSGCGKTTFLKTLNRMVEEEGGYLSGTITLEGTDIKSLPKEKLRRRVGMVFQQPIAFPHSIEKNLSYVLKYHGVRNKKEIAEKITESLQKAKLYDEVKDQLKKSALKLSGGQKQRLAIARSLCAGPEILLLDEPCSALDMKNTIAIEETLLELKDQYTFVIVTHNLAQAKRIADQVIFMDHGEVLEVTEKEKFFENPASEPAKEQIQYM